MEVFCSVTISNSDGLVKRSKKAMEKEWYKENVIIFILKSQDAKPFLFYDANYTIECFRNHILQGFVKNIWEVIIMVILLLPKL